MTITISGFTSNSLFVSTQRIFAVCGKICVLLLAACSLLFAFGPSANAEKISYQDKLGRTVALDRPVNRAIIFSTYEMIPALGLWDQVVGVGRHAYSNGLMRAVRPAIENEYPAAGSGMDVNIEAVLKAKPDLVITWAIKPEGVLFMEERGLRVAAVHPESIEELYAAIAFHGKAFGRESKAMEVNAEIRRIFSYIARSLSHVRASDRKKVLWLSTKPTTVAGGTGIYDDLVKAIGAVNPAATYGQRYVEVSMERILAWNPEVIFIWGNAKYGVADILNNSQWQHLKAVKSKQVFKAPEWSTLSPRAAAAALLMAAKVYPEKFRTAEVEKELDVFYRRVFGIRHQRSCEN